MPDKFTIIRDTREKAGGGWNFRASKYCEGQVLQKLDTGDYSIQGLEDQLCLERKATSSELAINISEDRFWREMERMSHFKYKFLICEFSMDHIMSFPRNSGIPRNKMRYVKVNTSYLLNRMLDITLKYEVPVILAGDRTQAQMTALAIIKKVYKECS